MNDRTGEIVRALIRGEHHHRYLTNAWFRHSVDTLVRFLPPLVEGLAARSDEVSERQEELLARIQADMEVLPPDLRAEFLAGIESLRLEEPPQ